MRSQGWRQMEAEQREDEGGRMPPESKQGRAAESEPDASEWKPIPTASTREKKGIRLII